MTRLSFELRSHRSEQSDQRDETNLMATSTAPIVEAFVWTSVRTSVETSLRTSLQKVLSDDTVRWPPGGPLVQYRSAAYVVVLPVSPFPHRELCSPIPRQACDGWEAQNLGGSILL